MPDCCCCALPPNFMNITDNCVVDTNLVRNISQPQEGKLRVWYRDGTYVEVHAKHVLPNVIRKFHLALI